MLGPGGSLLNCQEPTSDLAAADCAPAAPDSGAPPDDVFVPPPIVEPASEVVASEASPPSDFAFVPPGLVDPSELELEQPARAPSINASDAK
jgi:hypothetical protein